MDLCASHQLTLLNRTEDASSTPARVSLIRGLPASPKEPVKPLQIAAAVKTRTRLAKQRGKAAPTLHYIDLLRAAISIIALGFAINF